VESQCAACIEGLAVTLIEHLGNVGAHENGSPPQVRGVGRGGFAWMGEDGNSSEVP